ncbi:MAG: YiiX/YebB-like N1pC/P60 family cysteine hydrolase [Verrucomicrobiota bacterium]
MKFHLVILYLCLLTACSSQQAVEHHNQTPPAAATHNKLKRKIDEQLYSAQGKLYRGVARIKNPTKSIVRFSPGQIQQIKSLLQPGDVLLSFTEGYMSSVFLPGKFKHGITYIGNIKDRQGIGLNDDYLRQQVAKPRQTQKLLRDANTQHISSGEEADIIEAVAEGVRLYSLKKLLQTHINRLAVLRPVFTPEQTRKQLSDTLLYVDTPYDFRYDFSDASRNCCTELIYRTLEKNGDFNFTLTKQRAHWVLTADDIINYQLSTNPNAFEFILLAEKGEKNGTYNGAVHTGEKGLNQIRQLMKK